MRLHLSAEDLDASLEDDCARALQRIPSAVQEVSHVKVPICRPSSLSNTLVIPCTINQAVLKNSLKSAAPSDHDYKRSDIAVIERIWGLAGGRRRAEGGRGPRAQEAGGVLLCCRAERLPAATDRPGQVSHGGGLQRPQGDLSPSMPCMFSLQCGNSFCGCGIL